MTSCLTVRLHLSIWIPTMMLPSSVKSLLNLSWLQHHFLSIFSCELNKLFKLLHLILVTVLGRARSQGFCPQEWISIVVMSMCVCSWFHPAHWPTPDPDSVTLNSPASGCMRNKFLLFPNYTGYAVLLSSLKNQWTENRIIKLQIYKPFSLDSYSFLVPHGFHTFLTIDHQWLVSSLAGILINYLPR